MREAARGSKGKIGFVLASLGQEIVSGRYANGEKLPPEGELEKRFSASRSVIREAVKTLAAKGLVKVGPRIGTIVTPRESWSILDRDVLSWMKEVAADTNLFWAIDEVRAIIEPAAAALAAERATEADVERIREAYERMVEAARTESVLDAVSADRDFHLSVLLATQNPVLRAFDTAIDSILGVLFDSAVNHIDNFRSNLSRHGDVLDGIAARRPSEASFAMMRVIGFTRENMQKNQIYTKET